MYLINRVTKQIIQKTPLTIHCDILHEQRHQKAYHKKSSEFRMQQRVGIDHYQCEYFHTKRCRSIGTHILSCHSPHADGISVRMRHATN